MRCQNSKFHWEVLKIVLIYLQDSSVMSEVKRIRTSDTLTSPLDDSACHMAISGRTSRWLLVTYAQYESLLLSLNQPLHRQIFNLFPRQVVKQVTKVNSDLQLRKHFSPVDRSCQGSLLSSIKHPLSSYVSTVTKSEGQFLAFTSQFVVITIPRG